MREIFIHRLGKILGCTFFIILFTGCQKEKLSAPGPFWGTASAIVNGKPWEAGRVSCRTDVPCYPGKLAIAFYTFNKDGYLREEQSIFKMPLMVKSLMVDTSNYLTICTDTLVGSSFATVGGHGDVTKDFYKVLPSADNKINITYYNSQSKDVAGTFNITYLIETRGDPLAVDTLRFTNGKFYTRILR